jgi:hypothetical protein
MSDEDRKRLLAIADRMDERTTKGAVSAEEEETAAEVALLRRLAEKESDVHHEG